MRILEVCTFWNKKSNRSGSVAKDRLKLVLIHDRMNNSPDLLEDIRADIIEAISKYVEIDPNDFNIEIEKVRYDEEGKGAPVLSANIPIKNVKKNIKKELME